MGLVSFSGLLEDDTLWKTHIDHVKQSLPDDSPEMKETETDSQKSTRSRTLINLFFWTNLSVNYVIL